MKTSLLLILALALLGLAAAKPHNEGKRTHLAKRGREHKLSNRMEHHRREHGTPQQHRAAREGWQKGPAARRPLPSGQHDLKKDLHLQHVTEHNIEKKHEDKGRRGEAIGKHLLTNRVPRGQDTPTHLLTNRTPQVPANATKAGIKGKNSTKDGIPMESERLLHVTPRPPKAHKAHHKPSPAPSAPVQSSALAQPSSRPKAHRPPKKYSPKKHGWKKSLRKDKLKDKVKEKREKRDKRNKALHRAIAARKL